MNYLRGVFNCMSNFCGCFNCNEDASCSGFEDNDRTHLLADTVNSSPALDRTNCEDSSNEFSQSLPKKDGQIVQSATQDVNDVSEMDTHHLETQEWSIVHHSSNSPSDFPGLLRDIPNPDYFLTASPDLSLVLVSESANTAMNNMHVDVYEEELVTFQIP